MDDRLRHGNWKRRTEAASLPPVGLSTQDSYLHAPIGDDYGAETTEWTPLTRRSAAARAYTPVPVSRRTGLIAGGVVLAGGGVGVIGISAMALTVGLVAGAMIAADRLAPPAGPVPVAQHMPDAEVVEGAPIRVDNEVAVAAVPAAPAAESPKAAPAKSTSKSSSRRSTRSRQAAPARSRTPAPVAAAPSAPPAPPAAAPARHTAPAVAAAPAAPAAPPAYAPASAPVAAAAPPAAPAYAPAPPPAPAGYAPAPVAQAPAAVPPAAAPAAAPAPPASAPEQDSWLAQAAQAAGDLLGSEPEVDPLDDLVAGLGSDKAPVPTTADDAMDDLLADLDNEPLPTRPAPVAPAAVAPAAVAPPAAAPVPVAAAAPTAAAPADDAMDDLLADLDDEPLPTQPAPIAPAPIAPAPIAPAPVEEDGGWMASASALVGAVVDQVASDDGVAMAEPIAAAATTGWAAPPAAAPSAPPVASYATPPGAAPAAAPAAAPPMAPTPSSSAPVAPSAPASAPGAAPVAPASAPVAAPAAAPPAAPMGFAQAPASAYAPVAPPPPRCVGELCGDDDALDFVDGGNGEDLLSGGSEDWSIEMRDADVAGQFAGSGGSDMGMDDLDALDSSVVEIRTNRPGVKVEVDGNYAGVTPLLVDVSSGYHSVKLTLDDVSQRFELQPQSDPDAWCFDLKGRTFKISRCR